MFQPDLLKSILVLLREIRSVGKYNPYKQITEHTFSPF